MQPTFVIAGRFQREYILPPVGQPLLDSPGGDLLYAAGGLAVWERGIGLLGKVDEDLPRQWLHTLEENGFDIRGINILPQSLDLRAFLAYSDFEHRSQNNPVAHFARREMTFPKALLGYQPPSETMPRDPRRVDPHSPFGIDIPKDYLDARAVHLCPMDFTTQSQLTSIFKGGSVTTLSLDPASATMLPSLAKDLRILLQGVTIFLPSEEELRALFWGQTNDLWEMAEAVSGQGCEIIVIKRGAQGQYVYDALGKHRWEIPAYPARLADPTGAGDALCGGYLAGYHKTYDPLEAALYGGVSASLKVEGSGPFYPLGMLSGLAEARLQALRELARAL